MAANSPLQRNFLQRVNDVFTGYGAALIVGIILVGLTITTVFVALRLSDIKLLGDICFARGLITFTVVMATVIVAFVVIVSAVFDMSTSDEEREKRFHRVRDVLSVFVGILGTILGFYFGSAETSGARGLTVSTAARATSQADVWQLVGTVQGGMPAIHYRIVFSPQQGTPDVPDKVSPDGWIVETVKLADPKKTVKATIIVSDATGKTATQDVEIAPQAKPEASPPPNSTPTSAPTPGPAGATSPPK
jgi:hypothetical protein